MGKKEEERTVCVDVEWKDRDKGVACCPSRFHFLLLVVDLLPIYAIVPLVSVCVCACLYACVSVSLCLSIKFPPSIFIDIISLHTHTHTYTHIQDSHPPPI